MKRYLKIILVIFSILSLVAICCVNANSPTLKSSSDNVTIHSKTYLIPAGESKTINIEPWGKELHLSYGAELHFDFKVSSFPLQNRLETLPISGKIRNIFVNWSLIICEMGNVGKTSIKNCEYERHEFYGISGDFNTTIISKRGTKYEVEMHNWGISSLAISSVVNTITPELVKSDPGSTLFSIVLMIMTGIIILYCIRCIYNFRVLVYKEKKDNNHVLKKLIELSKVDPNRVLDLLREMSINSNKEGLKLTEALSILSDKILNRFKSIKMPTKKLSKDDQLEIISIT